MIYREPKPIQSNAGEENLYTKSVWHRDETSRDPNNGRQSDAGIVHRYIRNRPHSGRNLGPKILRVQEVQILPRRNNRNAARRAAMDKPNSPKFFSSFLLSFLPSFLLIDADVKKCFDNINHEFLINNTPTSDKEMRPEGRNPE